MKQFNEEYSQRKITTYLILIYLLNTTELKMSLLEGIITLGNRFYRTRTVTFLFMSKIFTKNFFFITLLTFFSKTKTVSIKYNENLDSLKNDFL